MYGVWLSKVSGRQHCSKGSRNDTAVGRWTQEGEENKMKCDITVLTTAQYSSQVYHLNNLSLPVHLLYPSVGKGERIAGWANIGKIWGSPTLLKIQALWNVTLCHWESSL